MSIPGRRVNVPDGQLDSHTFVSGSHEPCAPAWDMSCRVWGRDPTQLSAVKSFKEYNIRARGDCSGLITAGASLIPHAPPLSYSPMHAISGAVPVFPEAAQVATCG